MCKHILNAQVQVRAACCRKWFDCPQCHFESASHPLPDMAELTLICKKCKGAFRKNVVESELDDSDEYCPHCDNHYVIPAKTPTPMLKVEGEDARMDSRMLKDDRVKGEEQKSIFNLKDSSYRLG